MEDRVAVVTGAGSGVGRTAALALLDDGYAVALAGGREESLTETAGLAKAGKPLVVPTDVTKPEAVAALFSRSKRFLACSVRYSTMRAAVRPRPIAPI